MPITHCQDGGCKPLSSWSISAFRVKKWAWTGQHTWLFIIVLASCSCLWTTARIRGVNPPLVEALISASLWLSRTSTSSVNPPLTARWRAVHPSRDVWFTSEPPGEENNNYPPAGQIGTQDAPVPILTANLVHNMFTMTLELLWRSRETKARAVWSEDSAPIERGGTKLHFLPQSFQDWNLGTSRTCKTLAWNTHQGAYKNKHQVTDLVWEVPARPVIGCWVRLRRAESSPRDQAVCRQHRAKGDAAPRSRGRENWNEKTRDWGKEVKIAGENRVSLFQKAWDCDKVVDQWVELTREGKQTWAPLLMKIQQMFLLSAHTFTRGFSCWQRKQDLGKDSPLCGDKRMFCFLGFKTRTIQKVLMPCGLPHICWILWDVSETC